MVESNEYPEGVDIDVTHVLEADKVSEHEDSFDTSEVIPFRYVDSHESCDEEEKKSDSSLSDTVYERTVVSCPAKIAFRLEYDRIDSS